ncbi:hypothetical protein U9M48_005949 [Paspalum notatum var. saurae]|uniref:Transcription repressor n=1 Tax=Paspalum notatum var. saurae TaxID=547442 RepID=A0AAQ3PYL9_PASNO
MKTTTRPRGAAGELPASKTKKRKKKAPPRGFMCGCGGASSVSTVPRAAVSISAATATPTRAAAPTEAKAADAAEASAEGTPSVDSLLRQLRELERGVRALGVRERDGEDCGGETSRSSTRTRPRRRRHATADDSWSVGRVDLDSESVAVVTESEDPLGDFRRSMAQMVVANGITGGAELRELLRRFLALNSACHHHLILRAFADVWEELFAGGHAVALAPPRLPVAGTAAAASQQTFESDPHSGADTLNNKQGQPSLS